MPEQRVYVWSLLVRVIHWALVILFAFNYFILSPGGEIHEWVGYTAVSCVLVRCWYGLTSRGFARFSRRAFSKTAFQSHFSHLKQRSIPARTGHNPFGWMMVYAVLAAFITLATTGFLLEETDYFFGSSELELVHSVTADTLFVLACIHIAAVIVTSIVGRRNLIRAMITGYRRIKNG